MANDGTMVVGGNASLLVFDGSQWRSHKTRHNERIRDLIVDDNGRIWVASSDEFGYFEAGQSGALQYTSLREHVPESIGNISEVRSVRLVAGGTLFHTYDNLFFWDGVVLRTLPRDEDILRLTATDGDRIYANAGNRLLDASTLAQGDTPKLLPTKFQWPASMRSTFIEPWGEGQFLLGTTASGLYVLSEAGVEPFSSSDVLAQSWPYKVLRLPDQTIAVATIRNGIFRLTADGEVLEHINTANGLRVNATIAMALDQQGGLWLAQQGAIARVALLDGLRMYDHTFDVPGANDVELHQGRLFIANINGVSELRAAGPAGASAIALNSPVLEAFGLLSTDQGLLVAGSDGVHRLKFDDAGITDAERVLEDSYAYQLIPSQTRSAVYVEGESGLGVLQLRDGRWVASPMVAGIDGRPSTVVEHAGDVWVGSGKGQFYRLVWSGDSLNVQQVLGPEQGVPEGNAHLFKLGDQLVFATTEGGYGLDAQDRLQPITSLYQSDIGERPEIYSLFSIEPDLVMAVIDGTAPLWLGQVDGGEVLWRRKLLGHLDSGHTAFIRRIGDQIWFGRQPNLYRMPVSDLQGDSALKARVLLRRVGYPERDQWLLQGELADVPSVTLDHAAEALRFEFALPSFERPEFTRYRSRLQGIDTGWSRWSDEARRDFTNLPGGDYTLEIEARDAADRVYQSTPYLFAVAPPWYLSPLAWVLYSAVAVLLLLLAVLAGRKSRERRQIVLEQLVADRTAQVRAQANELKRLDEAKSRFFANVSHEFRTPLTLTKGPLSELASGRVGQLDAASKHYIETALRHTEIMESLVGQVLDINRLEGGHMPVTMESVDLSGLVADVVAEFAPACAGRHIELHQVDRYSGDEIQCDPTHIRVVIRNLLSNALKFTPDAGHIHVVLAGEDEYAVVTVEDSGPGIAPDEMPRIFERYYQIADTSLQQPGIGIGLSLVRDLVALHGGKVEVENADPSGARFIVRLPVRCHADVPSVEPLVDQPWPLDAVDHDEQTPTVLIVEDNDELRSFLRLRLQSTYRIVEAANGQEALQCVESDLPDVIISDVMMPKMDGFAFTEAIKGNPDTAFIPILMLTAKSTKRDTVAGLECGADDYLSKPFDTAELAARVAGLIASRAVLRDRLRTLEAPLQAATGKSDFQSRVDAVLAQHMADETFNVQDWANLMHMDRTTLFRRLKESTGQPPETYLREQRLAQAARLLCERSGNVSEVAVAVGFNSISYFSRCFRAKYGQPPTAFMQGQT